jgi:cytochrome b
MDDKQRVLVWDLPTRLFHWLLAAAIPAAVATGMLGGELMVWHGRLGLFILGLVAFRLTWGFVGSRHARFASFVRGPAAIAAYLRGEWRGSGHNPLGALSVLAMLGLIALQVGTGLFANDDIAFRGPLADLAGDDLSSRLTSLHALTQYGLIAVVVLHAAAIVYYVRVRRERLVGAMLTGYKELPLQASEDKAHQAPGILRIGVAFVLASGVAAAAVYVASGALTPPPAPAAVAAPAW